MFVKCQNMHQEWPQYWPSLNSQGGTPMTSPQFIFSLTCGFALMLGGYHLANAAVASWGLFWVGSGLVVMNLAILARSHMGRIEHQAILLPARVES